MANRACLTCQSPLHIEPSSRKALCDACRKTRAAERQRRWYASQANREKRKRYEQRRNPRRGRRCKQMPAITLLCLLCKNEYQQASNRKTFCSSECRRKKRARDVARWRLRKIALGLTVSRYQRRALTAAQREAKRQRDRTIQARPEVRDRRRVLAQLRRALGLEKRRNWGVQRHRTRSQRRDEAARRRARNPERANWGVWLSTVKRRFGGVLPDQATLELMAVARSAKQKLRMECRLTGGLESRSER
jgi:hypothetical protein